MSQAEYDIVTVGGGLGGAAVAVAMAKAGARVLGRARGRLRRSRPAEHARNERRYRRSPLLENTRRS